MSYERYKKECADKGQACVDFYDDLIASGNQPGFAAMLALRQPPGTKGTERAFLEGMTSWADSMHKDNRDNIFKAAKKAGISTEGKIYKGGLGKPSDPMAWISTQDDVKEVCKIKGYTCSGAVNYKAPDREPPKKKRIANDIRDRYVAQELASNPSLMEKVKKNPKRIKEVQEKVTEKHTKKR